MRKKTSDYGTRVAGFSGHHLFLYIKKKRKKTIAIDPETGKPFYFVFVDNTTSNSKGTYKNPYSTFAQAEAESREGAIIYVFPGDGTTKGMDSGITLKTDQKLWGSGIKHSIKTSVGRFYIPKQSRSSPTITNTNVDTEGNAITLVKNNAISGIIINSALNDAIFGTDCRKLKVSSCKFINTSTYAIEALFSAKACVSLKDNHFLNNVNGVFLTLNGTSNVSCVDNTFAGQTSVSSAPLEIAARNNSFVARIENSIFDNNTAGAIRFNFDEVVDADIRIRRNKITNSGTGAQSSLASSIVLLSSGTTDHCSLTLKNNQFSGNASNALYLHTSGAFSTFKSTVSKNKMLGNGGSALVFATPVETLNLVAKENTIVGANDNAIAVISSGSTSVGNILIKKNTIANIGNASNGIAINQDFAKLNLTILNNQINRCEGTGILSYAPTGIDSLALNISGNTISNCENMSSNAASGLDIEQFTNLSGSIAHNILLDNTGLGVNIGSTLSSPVTCLSLTGNNSSEGYLLTNPGDGTFNLSPCNPDAANVGVINTSGTINHVQSCEDQTPCPP